FPETVLGKADRGAFFGEWMDSYYARDIVELFRIRDPSGYLRLVEILFRRSTGQLETTDLAKESGLSRPTVDSYLVAMEMSHVIFRLRPFHGGGTREIVRQPKVYGFDTGFVCWVRGWDEVTPEVRGRLWEHLVLDELRCSVEDRRLRYWRDKSGREIDFVVDRGNGVVDTIEAKINPERVDHKNLEAFRALYPDGSDYVAVPFCERPRALKIANRRVIVNEPARIPTE
ncbi:MAG: ATP-binding protein, partial [Spirochaetota bacterium]